MKRVSSKLILIMILFIFAINTVGVRAAVKNKNADLRFGVLSDVHIMDQNKKQDDKFKNALSMLKDFTNDDMDALLVAGDLTDSGGKLSYEKFNNIYESILGKKVEKVFAMGNHEYYTGLSPIESQKRFTQETGQKLNDRKVIKGYNFITVSTENAALEGAFGNNTKQWLLEQLEECNRENSQKPIFVIVHQPVKDTIYGSDRDCTDELKPILSKYPQVICFAGHSHYSLYDERCIDQKDFTSVATGGLKRVDFEENMINRSEFKNKEISQGLFVEVNEKRVTITRIDFLNKKVMSNKWIIDEPCNKKNFKYTYARKLIRTCPKFKDDGQCRADIKNDNSVEVTFSRAYHDDFVYSYKITLIDKDKNNMENEFMFINDFFSGSSPDNYKIKLSNLNKGVNYKVKIKAVESFGNESSNELQCDFKI